MSKSKTNILNELNDSFINENKIIFKKYKPIKVIGKGSFGKIYSTIRLSDKNVFAMKTEKKLSEKRILETEAYYLFTLQGFGIPKLITYGRTKNYNILIETLLGKSLYELFIKYRKPCNLINTCLIAIQLIERLEFIHSKNIVYRDVKPENFMIGIKDPNVIYIIDFGLCKKYRSSKTGKHILPKDTNKFCGTLKYASSNAVKGKESSRRDDLISLGYALIYLYKRYLPWKSDFKSLNENSYLDMLHSKETNDHGKLFDNLPEDMINFVKYTKNLKFEQDPDYVFMKGCFKNILIKMDLNINKIDFTWININDKNIKIMPRNNSVRRSSPRIRILKSLENLENSKLNNKINKSLIELNTSKENIENTDDKHIKANTSRNLENHIPIPNRIPNKIVNIKTNNNGNNIIKKIISNKNKYNRNEKKEKKIFFIKNFIQIRKNRDYFSKINNALINHIEPKNHINITTPKNIYIKNNNNIFVNFENINKRSFNNEIKHKKMNSLINFDANTKANINEKILNFFKNNNYYSINVNSNINKSFNNNISNISNINFGHNHSNDKVIVNNNLDCQYNNKFKLYMSQICKDNNNNYIINNIQPYSGRKIAKIKYWKMNQIPKPRNFYSNSINNFNN